MRTHERFPLSFTLGADNSGNSATGRTRLWLGLEWGNALWLGDDFTYNYTTSRDGRRLEEHTAAYTHYMSGLESLSISGNFALSRGDPSALFATAGRYSAVSVRYDRILSTDPAFRQEAAVGFDYKRANNDLLFGGHSVFPTNTDIDQLVATYSVSIPDRFGRTTINASTVYSPGGITASNNDQTFAAQRQGATARYFYVRLQADRLTKLPYGMSWVVHAVGQIATANLLSSEALAFGGYQSVRGFEEQTAVRDNGLILTNELHLPQWTLGLPERFGLEGQEDRFTLFGFIDMGIGKNHDDLGGPNSSLTMISIGPGFTYQLGRQFSFRFAAGFVLDHHGLPGGYAYPLHVGLQAQF